MVGPEVLRCIQLHASQDSDELTAAKAMLICGPFITSGVFAPQLVNRARVALARPETSSMGGRS